MHDELLEVVDESGRVIGLAPRSLVHADRNLLHRVVHVLVVNRAGDLLLQKRSAAKDVAPGRWDTSVGGHLVPGESAQEAACREMKEELGVAGETEFLYTWIHRGMGESEMVHTFICRHQGPFPYDRLEIDQVRFWPLEAIRTRLSGGLFSAQFEEEFSRYLEWLAAPGPG